MNYLLLTIEGSSTTSGTISSLIFYFYWKSFGSCFGILMDFTFVSFGGYYFFLVALFVAIATKGR